MLLFNDIIEVENRCIMASLPYVLGDRKTHKNRIGELFCKIVGVSTSTYSLASSNYVYIKYCIESYINISNYSNASIFLFENPQNDTVAGNVTQKIEACTSPKLLSTGSLESINSLMLIAEGMVVTKFKTNNIVNAVICLLSSYYAFNAEYPKGTTGHSKNIFMFLEHLLLPSGGKKRLMPISVDHFITSMK